MNPSIRLLSTCVLLAASAAFASSAIAAGKKPLPVDVPPPPGMNDPGVSTQAMPPEDTAAAPTERASDDPLAPIPKPDARLARDKASRDAAADNRRIAASQITRRLQGSDTVEEYRQGGHVWMIRIVPQNGPTQTFMANGASGRLVRDPQEGPISPVYYTLYEWQ